MNVGELKDELDAYGDHLQVAVVIYGGAMERVITDISVNDINRGNELIIGIEVDA
jgi:hypothetical protein